MGNAVPVKHLLLLLRANAVVLVHEVEERALRFFQRRVGARLEIAQIGKDAFLELLGIFHRSAERLKSEGQASHDVGAGNVEKIVPVENGSSVGAPKRVPKPWRRAGFACETHHNTHDTYSPVGSKNLRMYWSGVQSTGAEIRKYFTTIASGQNEFDGHFLRLEDEWISGTGHTHSCPLAAEPLGHLVVDSVARHRRA